MAQTSLSINDKARGGSGMLVIFCDLAEADQADFRPWLMEDMFPARVNIGFNACASLDRLSGEGSPFVTLYEMPSLGHLYGESYQALRQVRNPRDADYHRKFRNPERYTLSWTGPELSSENSEGKNGFAPYVHIDRFILPEREVQTFNMWFVGNYLPSLAKMPEVLRTRRYLAMEGSPIHFMLHEFSNSSVVKGSEWKSLRAEFIGATSGLYRRVIQANSIAP